jgi:hypothetical protein
MTGLLVLTALLAGVFAGIGWYLRQPQVVLILSADVPGTQFFIDSKWVGETPVQLTNADLLGIPAKTDLIEVVDTFSFPAHPGGRMFGRQRGPVVWMRVPAGVVHHYHTVETPWGVGAAWRISGGEPQTNGNPAKLTFRLDERSRSNAPHSLERPQITAESWTAGSNCIAKCEASKRSLLISALRDSRCELMAQFHRFGTSNAIERTAPVTIAGEDEHSIHIEGQVQLPETPGNYVVSLRIREIDDPTKLQMSQDYVLIHCQ